MYAISVGMVDGNKNNLNGKPGINPKGLTNGIGLAKSKGLTNGNGLTNGSGLINGNGLTNGSGLINGNGLTNGSGLINGNGLTNGSGLINGNGLTNGVGKTKGLKGNNSGPISMARKKNSMFYRTIFSAIIVILLLLPLLNLTLKEDDTGIKIDGSFADWSGITHFQDSLTDTTNDDTNIVDYVLHEDGRNLNFHLKVQGTIFNGVNQGTDVLYIFIDTDDMDTTGFSVGSIGADNLIKITGWDGKGRSAQFFNFDPSKTSTDWNGWLQDTNRISYKTSLGEIEGRIPYNMISKTQDQEQRFIFMARHNDDAGFVEDWGAACSPDASLLTVRQRNIAPNVANSGTSTDMLEITLEGQPSASVDRIELEHLGNAAITNMGAMKLYEGTTEVASALISSNSIRFNFDQPLVVTDGRTLTVKTTLGTVGAGDVISLRVMDIGCDAVVTIDEFSPSRTYIQSVPTDIRIDGAFEDWTGISEVYDVDPTVIGNKNVNIEMTKRFKTSDNLYFYLQVEGQTMQGAMVPEAYKRSEPSTGGGGSGGQSQPGPVVPVTTILGRDVARVIIQNSSTEKYMLEVLGKNGEIVSRKLYSWENSDWTYIKDCLAENDRTQIEFGVTLQDLGLTNASSLVISFEMSDWKGTKDTSDYMIARSPVEYSGLYAKGTKSLELQQHFIGDIDALMTHDGIASTARPLTSMWTESARHYENVDGTITAIISSAPTMYRTNDGKLALINTNIQLQGVDSVYPYTVTGDSLKTYFPDEAGWGQGTRVEISPDIWYIWSPNDISVYLEGGSIIPTDPSIDIQASLDGSKLTYSNIYPDISEEFIRSNAKLKHNLILERAVNIGGIEDAAGVYRYTGKLTLPDGFSLWSDGEPITQDITVETDIEIRDTNGMGQFILEMPYAYEKAWEDESSILVNRMKNDGAYTVEFIEGQIYLSIDTALSWLLDPERQYPVVIDPTTANKACNGSDYTGYYDEQSTLTIRGLYNVGYNYGYMDAYAEADISSIPDSATIESVTFHHHQYASYDDYGTWGATYYLRDMANRGSTQGGTTLQSDITGGTAFISEYSMPEGDAWISNNLNAAGITDFQGRLSDDWFAVGIQAWDINPNVHYGEYYGFAQGGDAPYFEITYNQVPPIPTLNSPGNGSSTSNFTEVVEWDSVVDGDGDTVTYYWYVDTDNPPASPYTASGSTTGTTSGSFSIIPGNTYHWRVYASDGSASGDSGWSHTWSFDIPQENVSNLDSETTHDNIQSSINAASSGDRLLIKSGTYTEDVSVSNNVCIVDSNFFLDGDLTVTGSGKLSLNSVSMATGTTKVESGGTLTLEDSPNTLYLEGTWWIDGNVWVNSSTVKVNCSSDGEYGIQVNGTGSMIIQDNGTGPSTITANNTDFEYWFDVLDGATFRIENSTISECGWTFNSGPTIYADNAFIYNAAFLYNYEGLRLDGSSNSWIGYCDFSMNGNTDITLTGSDFNTIKGCNATSNNMKGYYLTSSDNNTIVGCNASSHTSIGGDGYYIYGSDNNDIINCIGYDNYVGLRFNSVATNNTVINFTAENNDYGIRLMDAYYNNITDSTIKNSASYGFRINTAASNNVITNSSISTSGTDDIRIEANSHATLLNTTFDKFDVTYSDALSTLTVQWYLHVDVNFEGGAPMPGATVRIQDNANGTYDENFTTNANGKVTWLAVTEYIENQAGMTNYTNHNITVNTTTLNPDSFTPYPRNVWIAIETWETFDEIPELHDLLTSIIFMLGLIFTVRKRYKCRR
jgi:parallel beta-helix repeat protein